ncbi:MAG: glycosyl transferase [Planctomycetes bacterium]|jgi:glycosyltransferase|nr:glycosyl transferase [Planctomycetota bacterium]
MKISIITAVYKREATIGQAIESVARQTYADVEHWIIDGASTDGTMEVVRRHQNDGMRILSEPDKGIYDALNKGIQRATGDVIGVVHSDDFLAHNEVLAKVAAAFADPTIDAVYGDLDYIASSDITRVVRHWRSGDYDPRKLARGWMPPHPTLFLRRRVFDRFGLYDTSYGIAADYDAILRYFGRGRVKPAYLPEVLVKMRVGGESNRSLRKIILKTREDYRALRSNNIGGLGALIVKNLSKLSQFVLKATPSMKNSAF